MIGICEFCAKEKELGKSTPFHGFYCMDCLRMNIEYDRESIRKMKPQKRNKITRETLEELEKEKDEVLKSFMDSFHCRRYGGKGK